MKYNLNELTKDQLWKLRQEIRLGSLYTTDYENSFDIPEKICQAFFDGYNEYIGELMVDDGHDADEYFDIIDEYDTEDNLYEYYYACEYPFGEELFYRCVEAPADWVDEFDSDEEEQL